MNVTSSTEKSSPNRDLQHIPGEYGLPLIGQTFEFFSHPNKFLKRMYMKYGPIFRYSVLLDRYIFLCGADAHQLVLQDRNNTFSASLGWDMLLNGLFPHNLLTMDFEEHKSNRKILQVAFRRAAMQRYLEILNPVVQRSISLWPKQQQFRFQPEVKLLTLDISAVVFMGIDLGKDSKAVNKAFVDAVHAMIALIKRPIPGLSYWKGVRGRKFLTKYIGKLIPNKRAQESADLFSQLCHAKEDNASLTNEQVIGHLMGIMMAAQDTSTSSLTTLAYALAKHKDWQEKVRQECLSLDEILTYDALSQLPLTEAVFKEALRLYAPVHTIPRRTVKSCEFNGYTIPANTRLVVCPGFSHHMPEYWDEPEKFDPLRFIDESGTRKMNPFIFFPFGGGAHTCLGMQFAYMEVKSIIFHLLRNYELCIDEGYVSEYIYTPLPIPKDGLRLSLHPIKQK